MNVYLRKYATLLATGTRIAHPILKAGSTDLAASGDWSVAVGDVKISIDGGTQANITNLPTYANGQWLFALTAAELTGKSIRVAVVDSATKAVVDALFTIETFGDAAAMYTVDYQVANGKLPATVAAADMGSHILAHPSRQPIFYDGAGAAFPDRD